MGTAGQNWSVDFKKFRVFLRDKYLVKHAYFFIGNSNSNLTKLYTRLEQAGFIVVFKEHHKYMASTKKGNVDCDIVFAIMKDFHENLFSKAILVTGDGDYKKLVDYLIFNKKFEKLLAPSRLSVSSLYKKLGSEYYDCLDSEPLKKKISRENKKAP